MTDDKPAGLRALVVAGLIWKSTSQVLVQLTRIAIAVVIARVLAPHEYGLAGMVLVFSSFVLIFADLALGQVIVQRPSLDELDRATAFWSGVGAGIAFTAIGIAAAYPVADFFDEPAIRPMLQVVSIGFAIRGVTLIQSALLVRELRFRALEVREIVATLTGAAVAVVVALGGFGAWAIVWQQVATAAVGAALVWRFSPWTPSMQFSRARLRSFAGFSLNVLGFNILRQLRATLDNTLIGRFLGAAPLGAYALAYNVVLVPFNRLAVPLSQVLFPALSRIQQERDRLVHHWVRATTVVAAVSVPSLAGLAVAADEFVLVALGNDWTEAIPVIRLLAIVGIVQTLQFLNSALLQALDRTSTLLKWNLVTVVLSVTAFVVGLRWGIVGVASAYAVASAISEPLYARATAQALGTSLRPLLRALRGPLAASGLTVSILLLTKFGLRELGAAAGFRLASMILVGATTYVLLIRLLAPEVLAEVRQLRPRSVASGSSTARSEPA